MRDFGVSFKSVPLMCDNTSAIYVAKNLVFYKRIRHLKRRHHLLRDRVEKWDIGMRYIDTERLLADIFTKLFDSSRFAELRGGGGIGVCHPYDLFWGRVGSLSCIFVSFAFLLYFLHTHLSHFPSPVILAYICLMMSITVLWWVVMRCETLLLDHAR
jgi:hypothetical protein